MKQPIRLDRRRFAQIMGGASLLGAIGSRLGSVVWLGAQTCPARLAYIGVAQGIQVYSIAANGHFIKQQAVASQHPVAMAIRKEHLYVVNGVSEFDGLPRGSVEAYAIDAVTGRLEFKNRLPLSLSAIAPRDLAVAPDGRSLVVAVHGGGAYNVVTLLEDRRLGRVSGILKVTGSGPHALQASAHPSAVIFDRTGRVLAADQGSDKLSVLSLINGELTVGSRCEVAAGSGPGSMVLDPDGKRLYVAHTLNGSLSSFPYDATVGRILDRKQKVWTSSVGEIAALAMHPSGQLLYSAHRDGMRAWKIATDSSLDALPRVEGVQATKLHVTADGTSLLALSSDAVLKMKIDASAHQLAAPVEVAALSNPTSIVTW
jgi:6-phosphogluconolactonase